MRAAEFWWNEGGGSGGVGELGSSGSVPLATSTPSGIPSPSVSGLCGSVPSRYSCRLVRPSPSGSAFASLGSSGLSPWAISQSSGMPSLSRSLTGWVERSIAMLGPGTTTESWEMRISTEPAARAVMVPVEGSRETSSGAEMLYVVVRLLVISSVRSPLTTRQAWKVAVSPTASVVLLGSNSTVITGAKSAGSVAWPWAAPLSRTTTATASQQFLQDFVGFNSSLLTIFKPRKLCSSGGYLPAYGTKIQLSGGGAEKTPPNSRTAPAASTFTPYTLLSCAQTARVPAGPAAVRPLV